MSDTISPTLRRHLESDSFSKLLDIDIIDVAPGYAKLRMPIGDKHIAMQGVTHGGAVFALADAALAVATHAYNQVTLALSLNINYHKATSGGDVLFAEAREQRAGGRTAAYVIDVHDDAQELVASLQAVVYRTRTPLVAAE